MPEPVNPGTKISLSELSDARRKLSGFRRTHRASDRQAAGKLLESTLTKAGVDLEPLKALQSQRAAAAREQIARIKAEADEQSSAALSAVEYTIQAWRNDLGNLSTLQLPPNVQRFLLDTASEIATTPGLDPVAKHIGPQDNSAQFHFEFHGLRLRTSGFRIPLAKPERPAGPGQRRRLPDPEWPLPGPCQRRFFRHLVQPGDPYLLADS